MCVVINLCGCVSLVCESMYVRVYLAVRVCVCAYQVTGGGTPAEGTTKESDAAPPYESW